MMTHSPRHPKTLASMLGALLALAFVTPAAAQSGGGTYSDEIRRTFQRYANAEEAKAASEVALARALAAHAAGTLTDRELQQARDQDAHRRFTYNDRRNEYTAAWRALRPDVPVTADLESAETTVRRASNEYLRAMRARGLADAQLELGIQDHYAQRIDGARLQALRDAARAAQVSVNGAWIALQSAWSGLDTTYVAAVTAQQNAENERLAAQRAAERAAAREARLAAERAAAEHARRVAEREARLAAERAAAEHARRVAEREARLAAERRAAEQARLAAERRAAEQARLAAERAAAERARWAAEQARLAAEQRRLAAERAAAEQRAAWERARRQRAAVPTATAQSGQGSVVVRPTRDGKSGEYCPSTATSGVTASATVRMAIR